MSQLSSKLDWDQAQNKWAAVLNPIIANPITNPIILTRITLASGSNVINHKLQRPMQGWMITDLNANVTIYRSAPMNSETITLTSSGAAIINLAVF